MKEARGRQGEEKHGGRRERESKASNERRSRQGKSIRAMQQPRLDGPTYASSSLLSLLLASLPPLPLSAPLAQIMALPYVSDANRAPLVPNESLRRGSALFLHSSIPETPDSFSLLNHAFLREREGERSVEVYFFLFYLSSIFLLSIFLLSSLLFERILFDIRRCCVVLF